MCFCTPRVIYLNFVYVFKRMTQQRLMIKSNSSNEIYYE